MTIIGIGSSAGGLEAIRELVATLPTQALVSYVVVQHMSPNHKSLMKELVARQTKLLVEDVVDGTVPQPNVVYITPPKADVLFSDGMLRLVDPSEHPASPKPSVDRFLTSLADSHGDKSVAIILSGTGSDGAYGVRAVREVGGITIAQDTDSAKYDGMPQSAVQTGCIDLILRPADIGTHLKKILASPRDFVSFRSGSLKETPLSDLMHILLARTRVDFRDYKQTTISRRIERRMVALGIDDEEEYTQFCRNNPQAVDALFKDLLISVTRFFRDKDAFKQLENQLPKLIKDAGDGPLRVWIAGCATGEEAYSIAMLLSEALEVSETAFKSRVQIFATDIDKHALQVARKGVYGTSALNHVPKEFAEKYLVHVNDGVRVVESLRNAILFSDHNVCQDPPFQKIDLLCCRNLLIYFGNALQQKVMSRFHYVMKNDAMMFLGTAESVAGSDELFVQQRGATHIFKKRVLNTDKPMVYSMPNVPTTRNKHSSRDVKAQSPSTDRQLFEALAQSLGKNSVLVTEDYSIARIYGSINAYIDFNENSNLKMHIDLLRSPLREEARSLVTIALKNEGQRSGVRHLLAESDETEVRLDVYPIIAKNINERGALIVFSPVKINYSKQKNDVLTEDSGATVATERIRHLESEVEATREALQQTIEELETSNEELQSVNEELQSTNEELQATNEELETSNEELQSTNEELITVNEELQVTATELSGKTGELTSVLQSAPLAILVIDSALQVTKATQAASDMFAITRPITSPHISQCTLPDGYPSLAPICSDSLKLGETVVREFSSKGTRVRLSCTPYFDGYGRILGLTLVVTEFPGLALEMDAILEAAHIFLMHRSSNGDILRISERSAQSLGLTRDAAIGKNIRDVIALDAANKIIEEDLDFLASGKGVSTEDFEFVALGALNPTHLSLTRFRYLDHFTDEASVYSVATDITDTVRAREEAQELVKRLRLLKELAGVGYWQFDVIEGTLYWSIDVYKLHGLDPDDFTPTLETALNFYHPSDLREVSECVARAMDRGDEFQFEKRIVRPDGTEVKVASHGVGVVNSAGEVTKVACIVRKADEK